MFGNILTKPRYGTYYVSNNGEDAYLYDVDPLELGSTLGQVNNLPVTADFHIPRCWTSRLLELRL